MNFSQIRQFFSYYYLAIASSVIVLLLALLVYQEVRKRVIERNETLFAYRTAQARSDIENRMRDYIQILKGAKGLFKASDTITRQDWQIYIKWLQIGENYPGIQGIGYTPYLSGGKNCRGTLLLYRPKVLRIMRYNPRGRGSHTLRLPL
jgi:CHASE1-domain containing sensor protein